MAIRKKFTDPRLEWFDAAPDLPFGERFDVAYKRAKQKYGLTQAAVEERARRVKRSFNPLFYGLSKLDSLDELEGNRKQADWLENAFIVLVIMGYEPRSFGINPDDLENQLLRSESALDLLVPTSPCISISSVEAA